MNTGHTTAVLLERSWIDVRLDALRLVHVCDKDAANSSMLAARAHLQKSCLPLAAVASWHAAAHAGQ